MSDDSTINVRLETPAPASLMLSHLAPYTLVRARQIDPVVKRKPRPPVKSHFASRDADKPATPAPEPVAVVHEPILCWLDGSRNIIVLEEVRRFTPPIKKTGDLERAEFVPRFYRKKYNRPYASQMLVEKVYGQLLISLMVEPKANPTPEEKEALEYKAKSVGELLEAVEYEDDDSDDDD